MKGRSKGKARKGKRRAGWGWGGVRSRRMPAWALTVGELAVGGDVAEDGDRVTGFVSKIEKQLGNTLLAVGVSLEGIDNPDLAEMHGCS